MVCVCACASDLAHACGCMCVCVGMWMCVCVGMWMLWMCMCMWNVHVCVHLCANLFAHMSSRCCTHITTTNRHPRKMQARPSWCARIFFRGGPIILDKLTGFSCLHENYYFEMSIEFRSNFSIEFDITSKFDRISIEGRWNFDGI